MCDDPPTEIRLTRPPPIRHDPIRASGSAVRCGCDWAVSQPKNRTSRLRAVPCRHARTIRRGRRRSGWAAELGRRPRKCRPRRDALPLGAACANQPGAVEARAPTSAPRARARRERSHERRNCSHRSCGRCPLPRNAAPHSSRHRAATVGGSTTGETRTSQAVSPRAVPREPNRTPTRKLRPGGFQLSVLFA